MIAAGFIKDPFLDTIRVWENARDSSSFNIAAEPVQDNTKERAGEKSG
jgi:hypothetical protein